MRELKEKFFMFGMGNRRKFVYKQGELIEYPSKRVAFSWTVEQEEIIPDEYRVCLKTGDGHNVVIEENEEGVFVTTADGGSVCLDDTFLNLPRFEGYCYARVLRVLHHEICINIMDGKPLPSIFVYNKPWYRDAAMMAIALEKTGNLHLIREWANGLDDCYDRNNSGHEESDNLGQALYVLAKTGNTEHPLIPKLVEEAKRRLVDGALTGLSDYAEHPVYQTKWLKLGLDELGLDSSWVKVPKVEDSYAELFWMDISEVAEANETSAANDEPYNDEYPYLSWAKEHFKMKKQGRAYAGPAGRFLEEIEKAGYPISSETNASEADYGNQADLFPGLAESKCSAPHSWHAAEMFLYLLRLEGK